MFRPLRRIFCELKKSPQTCFVSQVTQIHIVIARNRLTLFAHIDLPRNANEEKIRATRSNLPERYQCHFVAQSEPFVR